MRIFTLAFFALSLAGFPSPSDPLQENEELLKTTKDFAQEVGRLKGQAAILHDQAGKVAFHARAQVERAHQEIGKPKENPNNCH